MKCRKSALFFWTFALIGGDEKAIKDVRDSLPEGALARLGTIRQRVPQGAQLAIRPDGRTFVTVVAGRMIGEWDIASGTLRRQRRLPGAPTENSWLAPDGRLLAVMEEGKLIVWDVAEGRKRHVLSTFAHKVAFSADGKMLAATGGDKKHWIDLWDLTDGKERRLAALSSYVHALAFAPDGKRLFAAVDVASLRCWDVVSGRQRWDVVHQAGSLVVAPDGQTICTAAYPAHGALRTWEAESGRLIKKIVLKKELVWTRPIAFTSDSQSVLLNSAEGLLAWELSRGKVKQRFPKVDRFVLAPDGKTAITLTGSLVQRWDMESGRPLYPDTRPLGHANAVVALAFSPDGRTLATSSTKDTIRLWDLATRRPRIFPARTSKGTSRYVTFRTDGLSGILAPPILTFTPDSQKLLVESEDGRLSLRRVDTGEETLRLDVCLPQKERISTARISPDGNTIWTWSYQPPSFTDTIVLKHKDTLSAWDVRSGRRLSSHSIRRVGDVEANLISPDGRYAALDYGPVVDVATEQPRLSDRPFRSFAFSSDSRLMAGARPPDAGRLGEKVRVYEMLNGRLLVRLPAAVNQESSYAFSPDGRLLIAAGADALHVWDVAKGRRLLHLPAEGRCSYWCPPHFATCLAVAPDGRSAATGHDDGTVLLWDLSPAWRRLATQREKLTPARRRDCWSDMLAHDPKTAYRAITELTADAEATVSFLVEHLRLVPIDERSVDRWLHDLDADDFAKRERASRELTALADRIEPRLRQALKETKSLEARRRLRDILETVRKAALSPETVRQLRSIAVLEQIATPEARRVLQDLAQGESTARLTAAAQDALRRLLPRR